MAPEPAALRGESAQTLKRLAEAEQKVLSGKPAEAIEELQRILDEAGDDLVSLDGKHYRAARWFAHQVLAKLPADSLAAYRNRIDEPARKLLEAGRRDRDPAPLRQLLDRYFVSRSTEEASLLLGDLLFERGEFRAAEQVWKRLLPNRGADVDVPGAKGDAAAVEARMILAAIFSGEIERARTELVAFATKQAGARGRLAGKDAPYAETLRSFLEHPPRAIAAAADSTWPTFGGDPARTGRLHGPIPVHWPSHAAWTASLDRDPIGLKLASPPAVLPYCHPVIFDGWVYVSDGRRLTAFELATGSRVEVLAAEANSAKLLLPCTTLMAAEGRLYACIGPAIVCFESPRPGQPVRELWRLPPPAGEGKNETVWEGAPLVDRGRMWAAFAHFSGGRVVHAVACFDPADADAAPERPAWVVEACDSAVSSSKEPAPAGLLTLAGRHLVFSTNSGAVLAFDARTGRRAWGVQYPRGNHSQAAVDAAPAVASGGRVFVAPTDASRVYSFDAESGQELWESGRIDGGQILGVARNRVIIASNGPVRGIRGLNAATGSYRDAGGWIRASGLLGYGQGLAGDEAILWPSRDGLYFLDPETGNPIRTAPPLRTLGPGPEHYFGNLAFASGWLVAVTPSQIRAYRTEAPPFSPPAPDASPAGFQALVDRAERELVRGNDAAARRTLLQAARGDYAKGRRAWAAARLLRLQPSSTEPLPKDVQDALAPELLNEWLVTAEGEFATLGTLRARRTGGARSPPAALPDRSLQRPLLAPGFPSELRIVSERKFPPGSRPLRLMTGGPQSGRLFIAAPTELHAVAVEGEAARFAQGEFTQAAELAEGFVAAGPFDIAVYGKSPEPRWSFRVPDTEPLPGPSPQPRIRIGDAMPRPELSSFTLSGHRLYARLGERHLIAFDLSASTVEWVLGTHGRPRYEPEVFPSAPRFAPHFYASERCLVAQLSDGRRWTIQAKTGLVWNDKGNTFPGAVPENFGARTALVAWPRPPVAVDGDAIAIADGPGQFAFLSPLTGRTRLRYAASGETSLTGEPPQLQRFGDAVLAAVRRNYGVELDRLDAVRARSHWPGGALVLEASRIDLDAAAADAQRLYVAAGTKLIAVNLDDGSPAWEAALPCEGKWQVRAGRSAVFAYPAEALAEEPLAAAFARLEKSFRRNPQPRRLPWLTAALYEAWATRHAPMLVFDAEAGKRTATLDIPCRGEPVELRWEGDRGVLAAGDRIIRLAPRGARTAAPRQ